MYKTISVKTQR